MKRDSILLFIIIALGAALRLSLLGAHRFTCDESLYSYWAYDMAHRLRPGIIPAFGLEKPPIYLFVSALVWLVYPVREVFAELPNLAAGIVAIYLVHKAGELYFKDSRAALISALIFSLTPVNILYSATAYTDPLMVCLSLGALCFFLKRDYFWSGVLFGLALGTKQFAAFYLPFFALCLFFIRELRLAKTLRALSFAAAGFAAAFTVPFIWGMYNSVKAGKGPLFAFETWFGLNVLPVIFSITAGDIAKRSVSWVYCFNSVFVMWWLNAAVLCSVALAIALKRDLKTALIAFYLAAVIAGVSVIRTPVFDRYILTFAPFVALMAGGAFSALLGKGTAFKTAAACAACAVILAVFPLRAMYGYKIINLEGRSFGAMSTQNDGIDIVTDYVKRLKLKDARIYSDPDLTYCLYYYFGGTGHGIGWEPVKEAFETAEKIKRMDISSGQEAFLMFYGGNNRITGFSRELLKDGFICSAELAVADRFGSPNLILYRVLKKQRSVHGV